MEGTGLTCIDRKNCTVAFSRERDAVRLNSGQSVTHSDPGLMEPSIPPTADRNSAAGVEGQGAMLRPASHQHKNGREFEGGALISAEGAVQSASPSLDTVQRNRDRIDDPRRRSRCGKLTMLGVSGRREGVGRFFKLMCKSWHCPQCGPRKANRMRKAIAKAAESGRLNKMLTLTLDPSKLVGKEEDSQRFINQVWEDFRVYLKRRLGFNPKFICVREKQKNGTAHLHVLLDTYLRYDWVSEAWSALGGGKIVDIRCVDMHRVSRYLSKYLTKDMLLSAPRRSRRVTTSRSITLNPKRSVSDWVWRLIGIPIDYLYHVHRNTAYEVIEDAEGKVIAFRFAIAVEE